MNKVEELEKAVLMLEEHVAANKTRSESYQRELELAQKQLADVNKPELTPMQFDNLFEAVESGISGYDFSDSDNFDYEFNIGYENQIELENLDLTNSQNLVEAIVQEIHKLFTEAECLEELDTTEVDNHA